MKSQIRYQQINQGLWHHYRDEQTGRETPAIGLRQFYRFYGKPRLDAMVVTPPIVRWGSDDNRALPAEVSVHAWNDKTLSWELVVEKELPRPGAGKDLRIGLGGVRTRFLRVDCVKQHTVGPCGGEFWASAHYVPFDTLRPVNFLGEAARHYECDLPLQPPLRILANRPKAGGRMKVFSEIDAVRFSSPEFSVGFSLRRPITSHLGWDSASGGKSADNLIFHRTVQLNFCDPHPLAGPGDLRVLSGPAWNTLAWDAHSRLWGGDVSVNGNIVSYKNLHIEDGLSFDAEFEVRPDGMDLHLTQTSTSGRETMELDAWRFVWKAQTSIISTLGIPGTAPGRPGTVALPAIWAAPGYGNLSCRQTRGDTSRVQVESWRKYDIAWAGIGFGEPVSSPGTHQVPKGRREACFEFRVADVLPDASLAGAKKRAGTTIGKIHPELRRNWGPGLMFRAELSGFSNNAVSGNCHLSQTTVTDFAAHTATPAAGPKAIELARFTATLALKDGRGYGDSREIYQDSDPSILNMTGRIQQAAPDPEWLADVWPFARRATERILKKVDRNGLVVSPTSSGNMGSRGHVSCAWDCVNFGHYDGWGMVETYRALRNVAALAAAAGDATFSKRVKLAADKMKKAFVPAFFNPKTGWFASWRSRDGELHDYGHMSINACAVLFGLVPPARARQILRRMETRRLALGLNNFRWGIPSLLLPIVPGDYQGGYMDNPIWGKGLREDGADGFGIYCNGCLTLFSAYYIRAMSVFGFKKTADQMCEEILEGHALGRLVGGIRSGTEFYTPEGVACGYEGALVGQFSALLAIAQHRGHAKTFEPEFWLG